MSDSKPRILLCTSHCPAGPTYGSQLRTLNVARYLGAVGEVGIVLFLLADVEETFLRATEEEFDVRGVFKFMPRPKTGVWDRIRCELDPYYTNTHGLRVSDADAASFEKILAQYDVVWFHGIKIPNSLGKRVWYNAILDIDDIPSQFFESLCRNARGLARKILEYRKVLQWKRRESVLLDRFSVVAVCSEADRKLLGGSNRICLVPNGFDHCELPEGVQKANPPHIGFIGTLEYMPNQQGIAWFIDEVWEKIRQRFPNARLRLVGKGTEKLTSEKMGVDGLGWVKDAAMEIAGWSVMIVPILAGGGTRIKIAEAFSRRCPVVSTRLGSFGYALSQGEEILLADSADDFASACIRILGSPEYGEQMTAKAWQRFDREWSWQAIAPRVEQAVGLLRPTSG